jgi:hypothetical protein
MPSAAVGVFFIAVIFGLGLLIVGGSIPVLPATARTFPGLERWAVIGLVPLVGAVFMVRFLRRGDRPGVLAAVNVTAVAFVGLIAAFPPLVFDTYKSPKELVRASGVGDPHRDARAAAFDWFQPSVVFYAKREVEKLETPQTCAEFLSVPTPGYLFVPEPTWNMWVADKVKVPYRVAARHFDFYKNCDILVITNEPEHSSTAGVSPR